MTSITQRRVRKPEPGACVTLILTYLHLKLKHSGPLTKRHENNNANNVSLGKPKLS